MAAKERPTSKIRWLSGTFACLAISLSCIGFLCWSLYGWGEYKPTADIQAEQIIFLIVGAWLAMIGAQLFRLIGVWAPLAVAIRFRDRRKNNSRAVHAKIVEKGFKEHFFYLVVGLIGLSAIAFLSAESIPPFSAIHISERGGVSNALHLYLLIAAGLTLFLPLVIGFGLHAIAESEANHWNLFHEKAFSPLSFYIACSILASLVALAWYAGDKDRFQVDENFGIYMMLVVAMLFLSFVVATHISHELNKRDNTLENPSQEPTPAGAGVTEFLPARWATYVDSILVRLIAPLTGATQQGRFTPHILILSLLIPLCALGFVLASPFGLIPIGFAFLLVISLGRRWAWVENDRETASRLQSTNLREARGIQIGFENDLKDDALLGYTALFFLVPLALYQVDGFTPTFTEESHHFGDWLRFFGAELAKAVPFVDWWEIYNVDVQSPLAIDADTPTAAKHLTFASRALVDLVIMAALLQAFGIWQRARMQKALFNEGHVEALDPFTEREFFEHGMESIDDGASYSPKEKFKELIRIHVSKREKLGLMGDPYSPRRLGELLHSPNAELRDGANWMIQKYGVLAGTPQEQLLQLKTHWVSKSFTARLLSRDENDRRYIRQQKIRFEQLLIDIHHAITEKNDRLPKAEAGLLLGLLQDVGASPEFAYTRIFALELFAIKNDGEYCLIAIAAHLLTGDHYNQRTAWRTKIEQKFGLRPNVQLGNFEIRKFAYHALEQFSKNLDANPRRMEQVLDLLDWMADPVTGDAAQPGRNLATQVAKRLRERCSI